MKNFINNLFGGKLNRKQFLIRYILGVVLGVIIAFFLFFYLYKQYYFGRFIFLIGLFLFRVYFFSLYVRRFRDAGKNIYLALFFLLSSFFTEKIAEIIEVVLFIYAVILPSTDDQLKKRKKN